MQQPSDPRFQPMNNAGPAPFRADVAPAWSQYAQGGVMPMGNVPTYGDAAGEYMQMQRGRYTAMVYVVFGFLLQMGFLGTIGFAVFAAIVTLTVGDGENATPMLGISMLIAGVLSIGGAWWTFRDRWKCIEAFSSRYCSGLMNLSLLYVPVIAFCYANYRAIQKFRGR